MTKDDLSNHHSARERQGDVLIVKGAQFVCRILVVEPNQPQQFREYILFPPRKTHRRLKSEIIKIIRRGANYSSGQAKNVRRKLPFKVVFEFNLCRGKFTQLSIDVNTTQQQTELSDRHTKLGDNPQDYFRFLSPYIPLTMISSGPVARVRSLYLRVLGLSYAVALHSLYVQLPGLYGDSGIMPASSVVTNIRSGH